MRSRRIWPVVLISVAAFSLPQTASGQGSRWILRGYGAYVEASEDFRGSGGTLPELTAEVDGTLGFGAAVEYRFVERWGIELSSLYSSLDVDFRPCSSCISGTGSLDFRPLALALNFNLTPGSGPDVYLGPLVAYVFYSGFSFLVSDFGRFDTFALEDDFAFGAGLGVDIPVSESWAVNLALKVFETSPDPRSGGVVLDPDPTVLTVGFSWR